MPMKPKSLLIVLTAGLLLLGCPVQAQSPRTTLTWKQFTPSTVENIGMASSLSIGVSQALVSGKDGDRYRDLYIIEVDTENSLYDPSRVTDWDLRYNQILYDMALLSMKQAVQDHRDGHVGTYEVYGRYSQLYYYSKTDFIINSISGRDTAVIRHYEDSLKTEVAAIKSDDFYTAPFDLPGMGGGFPQFDSNCTIGVVVGYENNCYLTGLSRNLSSLNGFNLALELHVKSRFRLEMQYSYLWGKVETPNFYYDRINDYFWQDKNARSGVGRMGAGFNVLSREKIGLTPFAGLQISEITQDTGTRNPSGQKVRSVIEGGAGVYMGMDIDYRPIGTFGIRLKVFGSFEPFNRNVKTCSLNTGLTITL